MATSHLCPLARVRVLVLNASYEPIKIISWQRAMLLWLAEKVDVIEEHPDVAVHSVSSSFTLPSIVRIRQYVRPRRIRTKVAFSRNHIFLRDNHQCQYCRKSPPLKDLTLDHVVPATRGGPRTWDNLVTACRDCNQKKGSRTPEESGMSLLSAPRRVPLNFLPDILLLRKQIPETWKIYLGELCA